MDRTKSSPIRRTGFARLLRDQAGAVAVVIALASVPLIGAVGLAVDTARAALLKARLVSAIDAAALAGGRVLVSGDPEADIRMYFKANFPAGYLGATVSEPNITIGDDLATVSVSATASMPTTFGRVLGINDMDVVAENTVRRTSRGMELVLVMDNTGSMGEGASSSMGTMKAAATDLVNILYGGKETVQNFWIALVPYTATVNIGNQNSAWLAAGSYNPAAYSPAAWKGCVEARDFPYEEAQAETLPSAQPWRPHFWATTAGKLYRDGAGNVVEGDNSWIPTSGVTVEPGSYQLPSRPLNEARSAGNSGFGPNLGCGPAITPLTAGKTPVLSAIANMNSWYRGGTMANLGLAWGWRVLSPAWRGLWNNPAGLPLDYGTDFVDKVIVLLTDGSNQWHDEPGKAPGCAGITRPCTFPDADYTAYGRLSAGRLGTTDNGTANTRINERMTLLCREIKTRGVTVYTITFKVTSSATKTLYESCATSPSHYFNSPSNEQLSQSFREIASQLSNLRLER